MEELFYWELNSDDLKVTFNQNTIYLLSRSYFDKNLKEYVPVCLVWADKKTRQVLGSALINNDKIRHLFDFKKDISIETLRVDLELIKIGYTLDKLGYIE